MDSVKKFTKCIYLIVALMVVLFLLNAISLTRFDDRWENELPVYKVSIQEVNLTSENEMIMKFTMPTSIFTGNNMYFYTAGDEVDIRVDGALVYHKRYVGNSWWNRNSGNYFVIVPLDLNWGKADVEVVIKGFDRLAMQTPQIYVGSTISYIREVLSDNYLELVMMALVQVLGAILIIVTKDNIKNGLVKNKRDVYLGRYSILICMVLWPQLKLNALVFGNTIGFEYISAFCGALSIYPYILFMKNNLELGDKFSEILCLLVNVYTLISLLKHVSGTITLAEFNYGIYTLFFLIGILFMVLLVLKRNEISTVEIVKAVVAFSGAISLAVLGTKAIIIFCLLLFAITMWSNHINMISARDTNIYKSMAYHDEMTGMFNRTAYEEHMKNVDAHNESLYIIGFDLNNLKQCNDIYGHKMGDEYIKKASNLIMKHFAIYGNCYRIGGDEFTTIILGLSDYEIKKIIAGFESEADVLSRTNDKPYKFGIAYGYAKYNDNYDFNTNDTVRRADKNMYYKKRTMKAI